MNDAPGQAASKLTFFEGINRRDSVWLVLMSVMLFILLLPISSYVAALPFITQEWGLNNTEAGLVFSASLVGYATSALFLVPLTDRLGPRVVLMGSAVISVLAHIAFPLAAGGLATGIALRGVAGVGFLGVYVPGLRIVAERFSGRSRGGAMGLFVTAQYGANSASLAVTGVLMSALAWRDAYLVVALLAAISLPMAFVLLRDHRPPHRGESSSKLDLSVLRIPLVRYMMFGYSVHALVLFAVRVWLPLFLTAALVARGREITEAAVTGATVAGLALVLGSIGPVTGGMISDRLGRAVSASSILGVSAACSLLIGWIAGVPWALIVTLTVVYCWATAADSAIYQTGVIEASGGERLGSTLALQAFIGLLGGVAGPIVFGGILDLSPDSMRWGLGFSTLGVLAIIAILGLMRARSIPASRLLADGNG